MNTTEHHRCHSQLQQQEQQQQQRKTRKLLLKKKVIIYRQLVEMDESDKRRTGHAGRAEKQRQRWCNNVVLLENNRLVFQRRGCGRLVAADGGNVFAVP